MLITDLYLNSVSLSSFWNTDIAPPKIYSVKIDNDLLTDKSEILNYILNYEIYHFEEYRY